jgi:hypothetical protein
LSEKAVFGIVLTMLLTSMLTLTFSIPRVMASAAPPTQWTKTYGGPGTELSYSMVQTSDGGYALAGATNSYGAGGYDFWLVKVGPELPPAPPQARISVSKFFTDSSLNPLPLDSSGNSKVDVLLARGVVRSTNPGEVLAWVNVTNTGAVPFQSLRVNETLPVDWVVHLKKGENCELEEDRSCHETFPVDWALHPPYIPGLGAIHVYFANTTSLGTNPEITQPSTITVSTGNPEVIHLGVPNLNDTAIGHPLMPGQTILLSVKLTYSLKGTRQTAKSYPRNYTDTTSAAAWPEPNYTGTSATSSTTAFFMAYAKVCRRPEVVWRHRQRRRWRSFPKTTMIISTNW